MLAWTAGATGARRRVLGDRPRRSIVRDPHGPHRHARQVVARDVPGRRRGDGRARSADRDDAEGWLDRAAEPRATARRARASRRHARGDDPRSQRRSRCLRGVRRLAASGRQSDRRADRARRASRRQEGREGRQAHRRAARDPAPAASRSGDVSISLGRVALACRRSRARCSVTHCASRSTSSRSARCSGATTTRSYRR